MNDINRLVIFLLLSGLLFALYKYQHLIFGVQSKPAQIEYKKKSTKNNPKQLKYVTADNISQISVQSLENEKGKIYKQDSILGSLGDSSPDNVTHMTDVGSLFDDCSRDSDNTQKSAMTQNSNNSLFF